MTTVTTSDKKRFVAAALIILGSIGLLVSFGEIAASIALHTQQLTVRLPIAIFVSLAMLSAACFILGEAPALWQVPLQAFSIASVALGAAVLAVTALTNWHLLFGNLGFVGLLALIAGLTAGCLMRYLQARLVS